MAFLCGPRRSGENDDEYSQEYSEQPTVPMSSVELAEEMRRQIARADQIQSQHDVFDVATTWPDLVALDVDQLIRNAVARTHARPCPVCIYVRVLRGEMVEIGPELPRLCDDHMHTLCGSSPADRVTMHQVYKHVYDWYHTTPDDTPEDEYAD